MCIIINETGKSEVFVMLGSEILLRVSDSSPKFHDLRFMATGEAANYCAGVLTDTKHERHHDIRRAFDVVILEMLEENKKGR